MKTTLTPDNLRRIKKVKAAVVRLEPYGKDIVVFTNMATLIHDAHYVFDQEIFSPEDVDDGYYGLAFHVPTELGTTFCMAFNGDRYREETIWHEALHTTIDVLNGHGVNLTPDNHEPFAYTQGYLVSQIRRKVFGLPEFGYDD